jgi:hypothetical protein
VVGAPGRIRTCDTRFRKPMLYPLSYGGGGGAESSAESALTRSAQTVGAVERCPLPRTLAMKDATAAWVVCCGAVVGRPNSQRSQLPRSVLMKIPAVCGAGAHGNLLGDSAESTTCAGTGASGSFGGEVVQGCDGPLAPPVVSTAAQTGTSRTGRRAATSSSPPARVAKTKVRGAAIASARAPPGTPHASPMTWCTTHAPIA